MSITLAAAAAAGADRGWGNLIALIGAALVFWAGQSAHKRWMSTRETPSPTDERMALSGTKPQVKAVGGTGGTTSGSGAAPTREIDLWVGQQVGMRRKTMEIVREARRRFGASKMTTLRAIKRVKGPGGAS